MHLLPPTHERTVKIAALREGEGKPLTTTNPQAKVQETLPYKILWI